MSFFLHAQVEDSPKLFADYPFLSDIYPDCTDLEFQAITSSVFVWIYVSDGSLYFQDGNLFCTEIGDRDCRELYGLHDMPTVVESCTEGPLSPADTLSVAEVEVELRITDSFIDDESGLLCANVATSGLSDVLSFQFQIETEIRPVSFTSNILDANTIVVADEDSLFVIKSLWIAGDLVPIQLENVDPLYTVCFDSEAAAGSYDFTLRNTERLFSQFVVREESGDFMEIREVTLSGNVVVENNDSGSENDPNEESSEEGDEEGVSSIEEAFIVFPWLRDLDVCGSVVTAYDTGNFTFVTIGSGESLVLYFEDGTFYCSNSATFDCLEFYELTDSTGMWECSEG